MSRPRVRNRTEGAPGVNGGANCTEHKTEMKIDDCTDYETAYETSKYQG